jgi:hypothetical protein
LLNLIDLGYAPLIVDSWCDDLLNDQIDDGMPMDVVDAYWGQPVVLSLASAECITLSGGNNSATLPMAIARTPGYFQSRSKVIIKSLNVVRLVATNSLPRLLGIGRRQSPWRE